MSGMRAAWTRNAKNPPDIKVPGDRTKDLLLAIRTNAVKEDLTPLNSVNERRVLDARAPSSATQARNTTLLSLLLHDMVSGNIGATLKTTHKPIPVTVGLRPSRLTRTPLESWKIPQ